MWRFTAKTPRTLALSAAMPYAARAWHGRGCHRQVRVVSRLCIQRLGRCASTGSRQTRGSKPSRLSARICCGVSRPLQITEAEYDTGQDHCMTQNVIEAGLTRNRHGKHGDISSSPGPKLGFQGMRRFRCLSQERFICEQVYFGINRI